MLLGHWRGLDIVHGVLRHENVHEGSDHEGLSTLR